jgi:hypothetical protein
MTKNYLIAALCFFNLLQANAQWTNLNPPDSNYENYLAIGVSSSGKNIVMAGMSMDRVTFAITYPYTISNDYGATWQVRDGKSSQFDYLFWEGDTMYAKSVLQGGVRLIRSLDYGATFSVIDSAFETNSPTIVHTPSGKWYHNLSGNIYESVDKGVTWTMTSQSDVNFMDYTIADNGNIVATYNKGVGYSTDGGRTWSLATFSTTDTWTETSNSISKAADGSLIYMGKSKSRIYKSTDHGLSWQLLNVTPPINTIKLLHSNNEIISLTTTGATYKCTDETTFTVLTPAVTGILVNGNAMAKAGNFVYACGNSGAYRYGSGSATGILETMIQYTSVYPNPTTSYLNVHAKKSFTQYSVYDLTGKLIHEGSIQSSTIDVSELSEGMYFLYLTDNKNSSVMLRFIKE